MDLRKELLMFVGAFIIGSMLLSGCSFVQGSKKIEDLTISDIAYDVDSDSGYTVHVKEKDKFIPYLVLTANYNGNTLLLRKGLLDEPHKYGYGDYFGESTQENHYNDSGYYATSNIDDFLNGVFINTLLANMQAQILNTDIVITSNNRTDKNGLFVFGTETIHRKVFLISYTELGLPSNELANEEGQALKYFNKNSIIAYCSGKPSSYWLRSRYTLVDNMAWGIGPEGTYGGGDTKSTNGVRPAFCVARTAKISENDGIYILGE